MSDVSAPVSGPPDSGALTLVRTLPWRFAAGALALVGADVAVDPTHTHLPLCPLHSLTGWWCPFCGSLRAVNELARGHLGVALHDNVLLVTAVPVAGAMWLAWVAWGRSDGRGQGRAVRIAVVALLVAFAIARNLPFAAMLRPGQPG